MADLPPTSSAEALVPSTTALLAAVASTNDSLRQILLGTPSSSREAVGSLSRELNQIQTAGRLLVRHASAPDGDIGLPDVVIAALEVILTQTTQLVGIANQVLETDSSDASPLGNIRTLLETARIAINAGVDALSFTPSVEASSESDLPSYQSTQLLQDTVNLRMRVMGLSDSTTSTFDELKPAIIDFVDSLQTHIEETTGTLLVPPPGAEAGQSGTISDAASLHSVHNPALLSPAYSPIVVNHPAPSHIGLSHTSKRDVGVSEVYQLAYPQLPGYSHVVASMLGTQPTRIISYLESSPNAQQHPGFEASHHAVFSSPVGQTGLCAYVSTFHDQFSTPRQDSSRFVSESLVCIHDLRSGSRVHKYFYDDAKPMCFSPNGEFLLMLGPRNRLGVFTMEHGKYGRVPKFITSHTDTVTHAMYTPDSHAIVTLCVDGTIRMTDSQNYETLAKLDTGATKKPLMLGVCPDSDLIVAIFGDTLYRWHHPTGALDSYTISTRRGREGVPLAISPDCRFLACRVDNGVDITDLHKGVIMFTIRFQSGFATAAVFSHDSHSLAIAKAVQWNGMRTTRSTLDLWHIDF